MRGLLRQPADTLPSYVMRLTPACECGLTSCMASPRFNEDPDFDRQDAIWTAPKFFGLGIVTLAIAIGIIYAFSTRSGCSLVWVQ